MKITIYVLNTQDFDYQNLKRHPQYSKWFKYYCVRAHTGIQFEHIQFVENTHGKPVLIYDFRCPGSQAYISLTGEVLKREKELLAC